MGQTKSKSTSTAAEPAAEPLPMKAKDAPIKPQPKEVAPTTEAVNLPTKSWRALLQEQPLNPDAKPFTPMQASAQCSQQVAKAAAEQRRPQQPAVRSPQRAVHSVPVATEDEPEWMQYLSKKLNASSVPTPAPAAANMPAPRFDKARRQPLARVTSAAPSVEQPVVVGGETAAAGGACMVIHTEAYLKLLKEGTAKKKVPNANSARHNAGMRSTPADGNKVEPAPDFSMPMTTSSLVKKWSSVGVKKAASLLPETLAEETPVKLTTQDDLWTAKMLRDQDLSDPAYHSDSELDTKTSSSIHRLARRPNMAKASIRTYVMQDMCFLLDQVVGMMLLRLQRFTDQQRIFAKPSAVAESAQHSRRFVIGLKEVTRRTKQAKVECLIVAPDIEPDANNGGLDDRMRELLASAYQNQIPVIFALSRARLGKALGKSLHISVLGVLDARGAQELLKESVERSSECQKTWLARLEK